MGKQIPNWLFAVIIVAFTVAFIGLLGSAMKPSGQPGANGASVGKPAPDFDVKTADGKSFRLADYRDKVVLVNLWATWCGPCRMEIPDLVKLQEELGPRGFVVLGLSADDSLELAGRFARDEKLNYPVALVTQEIMNGFGNPAGIPATFLINKSGKIVWEGQGVNPDVAMYAILKPEIEKLL
ncbi:MAG: TlpA disulfide reductase family protein [Capsulimonadales bacterium]|nr:TlpA disulfide reductase family protein [Capsulimonadales bacterium]